VNLVVYGLFATGVVFVLMSGIGNQRGWSTWMTSFFLEMGLLLGVILGGTIIHEHLLRDEVEKHVLGKVEELLEHAVQKLELRGLRLLTESRRGYAGYYTWVTEQKPQTLFFAGRAVLHLIDEDLRSSGKISAADAFLRRLKENSKITIMLLDPCSEIIGFLDRPDYAKQDNIRSALSNFVVALAVCKQLADSLEVEHPSLPRKAQLLIQVYDHIPYFAYHKEDDRVIVGLYFLHAEGSSPAFEVLDVGTRNGFERHFDKLSSSPKSQKLLEFDPARRFLYFNEDLFYKIRGFLTQKLGEDKVAGLLPPKKQK
jgi:hypothetical protein